jgi:formate dehydrogenase major subunit
MIIPYFRIDISLVCSVSAACWQAARVRIEIFHRRVRDRRPILSLPCGGRPGDLLSGGRLTGLVMQEVPEMGVRTWIESWPVYRQLTGTDPLGRGAAAKSARSDSLTPRTDSADSMARSICPYCAVGCGQRVYVSDGRVTQIEGDPDSPISRGRLCPKGAASKNLVTSELRQQKVLYRRPYGTDWEELDLPTAMEMIADRVLAARDATWEDVDESGRALHRTLGIASLGGATLDNEENYLIKKLFTAMGAIQIENQARI